MARCFACTQYISGRLDQLSGIGSLWWLLARISADKANGHGNDRYKRFSHGYVGGLLKFKNVGAIEDLLYGVV